MGIFKKIGKGLKGLTKMLSIKNIKNAATGNFTGIGAEALSRVKGGLVSEFTKKSTHKPASNLIAQNNAIDMAILAKQNPNIKDILSSALGGALSGAGATISQGDSVQDSQAQAVDNVFMAWIKKNWLKALGIITGVVVVGWIVSRVLKPKSKFKFGR